MPETYGEKVDRVLRDHEGYTGDGQGGNGELPNGDYSTSRKPISKRDLRELFKAPESYAIRAELAAESSQWTFDTRAQALSWVGVDPMPTTIQLRGDGSVGDGLGGIYVLGGDGGDTLTVSGEVYGRIRDIAPARLARSKSEKWLITADWQPISEQPSEVAYLRDFLDGLANQHPDLDFAVHAGDLVDRASDSNTGAAPSYGYPELRADLQTRMPYLPWDRWLFLPGNHDRDGTGTGLHERSWTYETYRRHIGPEFYSVRKGNIVQIFLGDMAGSTGGEVMDHALDWFRHALKSAVGCNVIVWMHHPLHGVHPMSGGETSPWAQINGGTRMAPIIEEFADQIAFVGYGHVGAGLTNGVNVSDLYGVTHLNFSLAIPTLRLNDWAEDGVYSIMRLEEGGPSITIERWNASTHERFDELDTELPVKFPLSLGEIGFDFDGRKNVDWRAPTLRGPVRVFNSLADHRVPDGLGGWVAPNTTVTTMLRLTLADDANDPVDVGAGIAIDFDLPGKGTQMDGGGNPITGLGSFGLGARIAARRGGFAQNNHEGYLSFSVKAFESSEGDLEEIATLFPSTKGAAGAGLNLAAGARLRVGGILDDLAPGTVSDKTGVVIHENGCVSASRDSFVGMWQRQNSDGPLHNFYRGTAIVGSVSVTSSATAFNTSSDASLKAGERDLTFDEVAEIIRLVRIYEFQWIATGEKDIGAFAQELFEVYPQAVTPGGWFIETESGERAASAVEAGATYRPWAVDYSKLVPILLRHAQGLADRQDALEARIAALETA